jgi:hypothetical protein
MPLSCDDRTTGKLMKIIGLIRDSPESVGRSLVERDPVESTCPIDF